MTALRVVVAVPRPVEWLGFDADEEWSRVSRELQPLVASGRVVLERCLPASEAMLRARLGRPLDVLHLITHAAERDGHTALFLESRDGRARSVSTSFFSQMLRAARSPCVVVLQSPRGVEGPFVRTAASFALKGTVEVVGVSGVRPGCLAFYAALAEGRPLGEAAARSMGWIDSFDARAPDPTKEDVAASKLGPPRSPPPEPVPRETSAAPKATPIAEPERVEVFLCHNKVDKPAIRSIAAQLTVRGLAPWLDESELRAGDLWQSSLEAAIERMNFAAVFIGASGIGPWQRIEIAALQRKSVERGMIVIPVRLQGWSEDVRLPIFLEGRQIVDFGGRHFDPIDQLVRGILRS